MSNGNLEIQRDAPVQMIEVKKDLPKPVIDTKANKPSDTMAADEGDSGCDEKIFGYKLRQKRGKKAQSLQEYSQYVKDKIEELNVLIRDPNTTIEDRKKYRN